MELSEETQPQQTSQQTNIKFRPQSIKKLKSGKIHANKRGIKRKLSDPELKRELKKRKKLKRKERKLAKPNAQMIYEAKKIWEEMRIKKLDPEKRTTLINKLMNLIKGKIYEVVFKNDASRVVQCAFRYGTLEQKAIIFDELKDHIIPLAKNGYGHWLLIKMLMYGTKEQRNYIIKKFYGSVRKLHSHREAAEVLEYIYTDIANAQQRSALVEEFYGPEFSLFKVNEKRSLNDILKANPDKKEEILKFMREYFQKLIDKGGPVLSYNITHVPLLQYLQHASDKERREMTVLLEKSLPLILHTKEGSRIAIYCINYGNAKNRKAIIKSFKGLVPRICKEEFGHLVLLRIFDVVDDTVLVNKIILSEIKANLLDLIQDKYGRLVVLALLTPKNKRYFPQTTLELLQPLMISSETDPNALVGISKKDPEVRHLELLNYVSKELIALCKKYTYRLITHMYAREVFLETLLVAEGEDKTQLFKNILKFIDFDPQQMAKQQQDEDLEADIEQNQQKLQQQKQEQEYEERLEQERKNHDKSAASVRDEQNHENHSKKDEYEGSKDQLSLDDDTDDLPKFLKPKRIRNPLDPAVQEELKYQPREDLMNNYFSSRILRRIIEEEPDFAPLLFEKVKSKLLSYAMAKGSSFVVWNLLASENTRDEVSKLLRPSLEDLKSSMEAGTKAIVNFLTGERNNPLLDSIHQKTKKKHNNKHRNDQRS